MASPIESVKTRRIGALMKQYDIPREGIYDDEPNNCRV